MIGLWVLGGIAILLGLICCIPVGVTGEYSQESVSVVAHAGPFRILLYPRVQKGKNLNQVKAQDQRQKEYVADIQEENKRGASISMFRELLGMLLEIQAKVRNRMRIRELTLHLMVGGKGDDPAQAAVLYGSAWAAMGNLLPILEQAFRISNREIQIDVNFLEERTTIYAKGVAEISVGAILRMCGYYGIRGLKLYRQYIKKGGSEYGTSN